MNEVNKTRLFIQKQAALEAALNVGTYPDDVIKMVADFGGWVWSDDPIMNEYDMQVLRVRIREWEFIMDVLVDKIESIRDSHHGRFGVYIGSNNCTIQATRYPLGQRPGAGKPFYFNDVTERTKKASTLKAVISFIHWWNDHQKAQADS